MKKLALGALLIGLVACSKNPAKPDAPAGEGGVTPDAGACDVLANTGCASGEKCTWIWDQRDATADLGHIGCAMDGAVAANDACTFNMDPIGFDDCVGGTFCEAG